MDSFVQDYTQSCRAFTTMLKEQALMLKQQVEGSKIGDDPYNYYVPPENWMEAEKRVNFVYNMIKKYSKFLYSRQPLKNFVGMLNRRLEKLEPEIEQRKDQITFDFFGVDDLERMEAERDEMKKIKEICRNPARYFDAPHHAMIH